MARTTEGLEIGQEVIIKTIAEVSADDTKNNTRNLTDHRCYFNPMMGEYSGRKATITSFEDNEYYIRAHLDPPMGSWCWAPYMLRPFVSKYPSNHGKAKHATSVQGR